ncbi:MAG TPA: hypothetical protein VF793_17485 [Telluria sp.]|jgi:hypothetical protein
MTTTTKIRTRTAAALLLAGLCGAGLARAQSHSVTNYSNPPGTSADSKAATEATPGQSATADQQDSRHAGKGVKDAKANKGKAGRPAKAAKAARKGAGQRSASKAAAANKSEDASAPVNMDGASKGGTDATMQNAPSDQDNSEAARHAFDNTPAKK